MSESKKIEESLTESEKKWYNLACTMIDLCGRSHHKKRKMYTTSYDLRLESGLSLAKVRYNMNKLVKKGLIEKLCEPAHWAVYFLAEVEATK